MPKCDYCATSLWEEQKDQSTKEPYLVYKVQRTDSNFPDLFYFCDTECRDEFIRAAKSIEEQVESAI